MFKKIEHIGIAVKSLDTHNEIFKVLSELNLLKIETVESEGVRTSFFQIGESKIEFLESIKSGSSIEKFIEKNGEGIHHIAFEVDNVQSEINRLQEKGIEMIHVVPKEGADNKMIAFIHPKSSGRVLMEMCQEKKMDEQQNGRT